MLVVTAFCPKDADQALRQAQWLRELGGAKGHELLLIADTACPLTQVEEIRAEYAASFDAVELLPFVDHYRSWPRSPNDCFATSARHIMRTRQQPWFFCEPDCIFLVPAALDKLWSDYQQAGKPFYGDLVSAATAGINVVDHCSGNMIVPADLFTHAGLLLIADDVAFDVAAASQIVPQMHKSELIMHRWKHPPFESWEQVQREIFDVKPNCVLFHADKRMSLYPLLRAHILKPMPKRGPNGINDGPCSVDGCDKPSQATGVCRMHYARRERNGNFELQLRPSLREKMMENRMVVDNGCWLWTAGAFPSGYGEINVEIPGGKSYQSGVHRIAYQEFVGPIPDGLNVCHSCDVKLCFNPEHLFLGTDTDNMRDAAVKGRLLHGEEHSWAKLSAADVKQIREEYATGNTTQKALAERYGCTQGNVNQIVLNKIWKLEDGVLQ